MNIPPLKLSLPPVLDFEASSLSDSSYPITAGLVVISEVKYWIIKRRPEWVDWSLESQAIHGIKKSYLLEHGTEASKVYAEIRPALEDARCVYSDNPYWEWRWLACLGPVDLEVLDIRELVPLSLRTDWEGSLKQQFEISKFSRHQADHDAYALALAVAHLRSVNEKR